jgi:hypothetical protein
VFGKRERMREAPNLECTLLVDKPTLFRENVRDQVSKGRGKRS